MKIQIYRVLLSKMVITESKVGRLRGPSLGQRLEKSVSLLILGVQGHETAKLAGQRIAETQLEAEGTLASPGLANMALARLALLLIPSALLKTTRFHS